MKPKLWFMKDKELVYREAVADANWKAINNIVEKDNNYSKTNPMIRGSASTYTSRYEHYQEPSGTYLVNAYEGVPVRYEHIPAKKSKTEAISCPYCLTMNIVNYDKLPAVSKLSCGACGGNLDG